MPHLTSRVEEVKQWLYEGSGETRLPVGTRTANLLMFSRQEWAILHKRHPLIFNSFAVFKKDYEEQEACAASKQCNDLGADLQKALQRAADMRLAGMRYAGTITEVPDDELDD